jgi:hypothetical protein
MPTRRTRQLAQRDKRQGKAPTTQAGEFIREEFHHIRKGQHGARSPQQVIAIGLSKARRSGVEVKPPSPGQAPEGTRRKAERDYRRGHGKAARRRVSARRSAATELALKRESRASASKQAISGQTRRAATRRSPAQRSAAARRAARTKGAAVRSVAAKRAAHARAARTGA